MSTPAKTPDASWSLRVDLRYVPWFTLIVTNHEFQNCETFRDQIRYITAYFPTIPEHQIALLFHVNTQSVSYQISCLKRGPRSPGRPTVLDDEIATEVMNYIRDRNGKNDPPTVNAILNWLWENKEVDMLPDTLRKWLNAKTEYKTMIAKPMEEARMGVTIDAIREYFIALEDRVTLKPAALVINLDESGFDQYSDAHHSAVVVPKTYTSAFYPVPRNEKHSTFLAAVAANGQALKPLVITQRKTIDQELWMAGYNPDNVAIVHSENGYITASIFLQYLEKILIPYVNTVRQNLRYMGKAVVIMDGCSCHCIPEANAILAAADIEPVILPPHTSDQTQPCDLGLFGNMKNAQSRIHVAANKSTQTKQIIRMVSAYHAVCYPAAVLAAFRRSGISTLIHMGVPFTLVTRWTAGAIRNAPEEWQQAIVDLDRIVHTRIPIGSGP